jgi:DNA polymerase
LKTVSTARYLEEVEMALLTWAVDEGPVQLEITLGGIGASGHFDAAMAQADTIVAHNSMFDRGVLTKYGYEASLEKWYCTLAQAHRHGLPGALDKLCDIFNVPADQAKLKAGHAAMLLFCKPQKDGTWATAETHPDQWAVYLEYAKLDISAMRAVHKLMPRWNDGIEAPVRLLDQRINERGFCVDTELASKAVTQLARVKKDLAEQTAFATGGAVSSATQVDKLIKYILAEYGVDLPNCQADTLERRLQDHDLPDPVRELLALRQASSKTSTGKYAALLKSVSSDGRLRQTMTYCGAPRTGRWAGKVFQPHNLPRRTMPAAEVEFGIASILADTVDLVMEQSVPGVCSNAIRGCVVAAPGKRLLVADLSNIEGRVVAWLAGEAWKLDAFRAYDAGTGPDLYRLAFSKAFAALIASVTDEQRQIGKVMELMLGFGGGVGAFLTGAATYGIDLDVMAGKAWPSIPLKVKLDAQAWWEKSVQAKKTYGLTQQTFCACDGLKRLWRLAHPKIEAYWYAVEDAVRMAMETQKTQVVGQVKFIRAGSWLKITLPSGRELCYPGLQWRGDKITYMGQSPYTRTWGRIATYGGKLVENITQAVARDVLAAGMLLADRQGYEIVLHVHDEIVAEAGEDKTLQGLIDCLVTSRRWTEGLPLAAKGFECTRYKKD